MNFEDCDLHTLKNCESPFPHLTYRLIKFQWKVVFGIPKQHHSHVQKMLVFGSACQSFIAIALCQVDHMKLDYFLTHSCCNISFHLNFTLLDEQSFDFNLTFFSKLQPLITISWHIIKKLNISIPFSYSDIEQQDL